MRAHLVYDADGKVVSATVVRADATVPGDISPIVAANHRSADIDISHLIESERAHAKSDDDAIARAISRLMMGGSRSA